MVEAEVFCFPEGFAAESQQNVHQNVYLPWTEASSSQFKQKQSS